MNEALVERAVREMSPSAFCKMVTFWRQGKIVTTRVRRRHWPA